MKFSANRRIVLALLAFVAVGALAALWRGGLPGFGGGSQEDKKGEGRRGDQIVTVSAAPSRLADVPVTIDAVGTVQALNTVTVRTQVDGRLIKLGFTEGQEVKKGDILAEIDPSLYQAQYDQAVAKKAQDEANLANARLDLARYQKLVAGNFASQQQFSTQKALVAQLEAQIRADAAMIENTKTTLDYATIRSPIDGRVGIRLVDAGNILRASDQQGIVVITQLKPIFVVFTVPQQSLAALQQAETRGPAKANALGPDNVSVIETGEVSVIDNQIDPQTGTVRVKAVFQNADLHLWPGQFVNVRVTVDMLKDVVVVPSPAVQRGPNGAFVYLYGQENVAVMRQVTTGRQDENLAVITSGLNPQENVIVSGFTRLSNGSKVRMAESKAQQPEAAPVAMPASSAQPGAAVAGDGRVERDGGRRRGSGRHGPSQ